ncbi:MAG TPA: dipeptide ABC transporter ATP-binding protein [Acidimicrobiales bacterium]|nr:dipeptide ABC transporter ATP-binding protein [Acidimicrobiales bacterium]
MAPALEINDLSTHIKLSHSVVQAVGDISLSIGAGETLGLVGESGCGKSMTGLSIMRLLPNGGHIVSGSIKLGGRDLVKLTDAEIRDVRGNEVAMVFQDSASSLNPTMTVGDQISEQVLRHRDVSKPEALERAVEVLATVGLPYPQERIRYFPHQLSGGQRQRVMIAMALSCDPTLLIADEPTTALDVTIQSQILGLLDELKERMGMAILLITHDMGVVAGRSDRVNVMYAGRIVETAPTAELFAHMHHPYTQALLGSIPLLTQDRHQRLYSIPGLPPDLTAPPAGCRFAARCHRATEKCRSDEPPLEPLNAGHFFACWHPVDGPVNRASAAPSLRSPDAAGPAGTRAPGAGQVSASTTGTAAASPDEPGPDRTGPDRTGPAQATSTLAGLHASLKPSLPNGVDEGASAVTYEPEQARHIAERHRSGREDWAKGSDADNTRLLVVENAVREYPVTAGVVLQRKVASVKAVSGVSFTVGRGETFGLVGESGCGKTSLGKMIVGLEKPDAGRVMLRGTEIGKMTERELRHFRRDLQMVFQDPIASLDPRMRVGAILREPMRLQGVGTHKEQDQVINNLLGEVGLPVNAVERFPHEFSGGQRQRIGLARALTLNPQVIVADEPVSALDVSIRSQVLNLMKRLQQSHGLTYVVISHDLAVVKYMADRIGVMYLGKLVEMGSGEDIYFRPAHHYTAGLIAAVPEPDPSHEGAKKRIAVSGELPSPVDPPSGCRFRTRCPAAQEICSRVEPPLRLFHPGHVAACHFPLQPPAESEAAAGLSAGAAQLGVGLATTPGMGAGLGARFAGTPAGTVGTGAVGTGAAGTGTVGALGPTSTGPALTS